MSEADPPEASQGPEQARRQPAKGRPGRNRVALIGGGALLAVTIAAGLIWWIQSRDYQVTKDAYLDGDIVYVAPQIAGRVVRVWITDNQLVAAGQPLVDIDPALSAIQAAQAQAQILRYTRIYAAAAGYVTHRTVALGDSVQPGQQLMAITPLHLWVTANYKETQLHLMRKGQPAWIHIDAIPGKTFRGHVDSFSHGAARAFALQPPLSATGNFMKVVQPVPVKIVFDDNIVFDRPIGPGMSVEPRVKVR